ncbi:alpha/beta hydrolase [Dictyobacter arantiisoli]|uniref:Acetylesterase n=1 Tax=Dictyobacter arantiisoli TaxID=2014874 RepID=A0A5A5TFB0_9CHLR|nr:alpha/beta hydrolase [Dictyobacter arantiisoli]GCF09918.1 acetylesterase [Dictyobacter arantiisoli]
MIHETFPLWEEGQYVAHANIDVQPRLETYVLAGEKKRGAIVICPGGGYGILAPREAEPVALQFAAAGFHAFVLYYSVAPSRHPQPLRDLSRALNIIRDHADEWQIDSQQIAVCGFSAGGHLAASLGVHWDQPYCYDIPGLERGKNQPNALILCYPVITSGPFAHRGSFNNLLGADASAEVLQAMSLEQQINAQTPPTFLWHTVEDASVPVENSLLFASGLRKQQIPFELHIYPHGPHGLSLASVETDDGIGHDDHLSSWIRLATEWLHQLFAD